MCYLRDSLPPSQTKCAAFASLYIVSVNHLATGLRNSPLVSTPMVAYSHMQTIHYSHTVGMVLFFLSLFMSMILFLLGITMMLAVNSKVSQQLLPNQGSRPLEILPGY